MLHRTGQDFSHRVQPACLGCTPDICLPHAEVNLYLRPGAMIYSYVPPGTLYMLELPQAASEPVCLHSAHFLVFVCSTPILTADENNQCQRLMPVSSCMHVYSTSA